MSIWKRTATKTAVLLAVGLAAASCASPSDPDGESIQSSGASVAPAEEPPRTPTPLSPEATALPDLGPAPDITNEVWLNTDEPLNLAALRGKVVLVEFWTFG